MKMKSITPVLQNDFNKNDEIIPVLGAGEEMKIGHQFGVFNMCASLFCLGLCFDFMGKPIYVKRVRETNVGVV